VASDSDFASKLALTLQGQEWLSQFEEQDRRLARDFLAFLTLVSHNEFERTLESLILQRAKKIDGPIALFVARELTGEGYFSKSTREHLEIDATPRGSDIGSEGRLASFTRNLSRSNRAKFLNHPSLTLMRERKCRAIFVVDDLLGSGTRVSRFLSMLWSDRTIRSWKSLGYFRFEVLAYAATERGSTYIEKHLVKPEIHFHRFCPVLTDIHPERLRDPLKDIFKKYGARTSKRNMMFGYKESIALLVFEHGCPNNAPAILWAPTTSQSTWRPLFPDRSVVSSARSAFPPALVRRDSASALLSVGLERLARKHASIPSRPLSKDALTLLALISKKVRTPSSLCFSLQMSVEDCNSLLERCIEDGYITPRYRLTDLGAAELRGALRSKLHSKKELPDLGSNYYYPTSLRSHTTG
jgi:hypothetical protein